MAAYLFFIPYLYLLFNESLLRAQTYGKAYAKLNQDFLKIILNAVHFYQFITTSLQKKILRKLIDLTNCKKSIITYLCSFSVFHAFKEVYIRSLK